MPEVTILYEDENLLILDKPSGLSVHADGKRTEETLADWIIGKYPELTDVGEPTVLPDGGIIKRPGIVHRLDKETSGVMAIAKNQETFEYLKNAFQNHEIKKVYSVFVYGLVKDDKGVIDFSIGRSRKDFRLRSAQPKAKGELREALTNYRVLLRGKGHTYLEAEPKTGRTHQIRAHFKAIHHPVVCDRLYAPNHPCDLGLSRLALHARSLTFTLIDGKEMTFESPLPDEFKAAEEKLKAQEDA